MRHTLRSEPSIAETEGRNSRDKGRRGGNVAETESGCINDMGQAQRDKGQE